MRLAWIYNPRHPKPLTGPGIAGFDSLPVAKTPAFSIDFYAHVLSIKGKYKKAGQALQAIKTVHSHKL